MARGYAAPVMQPATLTGAHASLTAALAAAGPLALLAYGALPARALNRRGPLAARAAAWISLAAFGAALLAGASLAGFGPARCDGTVAGPLRLGVYFDPLAAILLALISFLLAVVARFSVHYLAGDPAQGRFAKWLCLTGGSVLAMVISGNLIQFTLAWSATSLCLHQLLLFYPGRPGAVLAARKKFLVSRLGDACLLAVIALVFRQFGTWDFTGLFAAAHRLHAAGGAAPGPVSAICLLLVAGAMLKSAQFPFHSWLPDTMETPTPVSALMHAGIINAGGFLIIRLHPLVTLSPAALSGLALFGAFTALFGSLVMLTHASVKRALAFSTVAQMGFMMLECGLGAFSLAVLHLVAHSLYKAHAFLSSGSIVSLAKAAWVPSEKPAAHPFPLVAAFGTAALLVLGGAWVFGGDWRQTPGLAVLAGAFAMALAYALWNLWGRSLEGPLAVGGVIFTGAIAAAYGLLHRLFTRALGSDDWVNAQLVTWPGLALLAVLLALFLIVLVWQTELPQWANHPRFQRLYVHARNGFYCNTLANRAVAAWWPPQARAAKHSHHERHPGIPSH
jgi:NAD(P)H-quinone oxidoreductase subunit 5